MVIKQENGYLGTYRHTLTVGATQHFVFQNDDDGPFWMSEQERAAKKEDRVLQGQTKKKKLHKSGAHTKVTGTKYSCLRNLQEN